MTRPLSNDHRDTVYLHVMSGVRWSTSCETWIIPSGYYPIRVGELTKLIRVIGVMDFRILEKKSFLLVPPPKNQKILENTCDF